jgi:predicted transcriptional regulator
MFRMVILAGFSTKQLKAWHMRREGLTLNEIGGRLGVTKQAVSRALKETESKILNTLETTAKAANIAPRYIDASKGILLGFSYETGESVVVTFSTRHGPHIWHHGSRRCDGCGLYGECMKLILDEAEDRGIELTGAERANSPADIAREIFSRVLPGVEP